MRDFSGLRGERSRGVPLGKKLHFSVRYLPWGEGGETHRGICLGEGKRRHSEGFAWGFTVMDLAWVWGGETR